MANIPDIGDTVATAEGAGGVAWGVLQTPEGVFVQFSPGGDWRLVAAQPEAPAAPAPAQHARKVPASPTDLPEVPQI